MNDPIKLIGFPNTGLLVFHAGIERGFFEKHGALVELEVTPSSIYQLVNLIDGKFDIGVLPIYQEKPVFNNLPLFYEMNSLYCGKQHPLFNHNKKSFVAKDQIGRAHV